MKDKLLDIINNYGVDNQQRKFEEEVFELQQAINTYELQHSVEYEIPLSELIGSKKHIIEEISDCLVLLKQFQYYYDIKDVEIKHIMKQKIDRQIGRIVIENER